MKEYYKTDLIKLYNGDCVEVMDELIRGGQRVDKIITSPPYNIIRPNRDDRGYDLYQDGMTNEEYIEWTIEIFNRFDKILNKNGCIAWNMSYGTENTENMNLTIAEILKQTNFTLADILVWKKSCAMPNSASSNKMTRICEFVYIFCRREEFDTFTSNKRQVTTYSNTGGACYENMFNFFEAKNNDESTDLNKATYSTDFVFNIIDRYVKPDDIVLDNFSGTGTTLKACVSKQIKGIGIELSEKQCEYTVERLKSGTQLTFI